MLEHEMYRSRLILFANRLGFIVELDSKMEDWIEKAKMGKYSNCFDEEGNIVKEFRPAGDVHYKEQLIRVREGKGIKGQISTLIHEIAHILGLGGYSPYSFLGENYIELAAESVTHFVTQAIGIDRTKQTAGRIMGYGFKGYLVSPVTEVISKVLFNELTDESNF